MSDDESVTMAKSSRILATPLPSCARVPRQEDDDTRYTKDPTDKNKTKKLQMSEDESVTNGEPAGRSTAMASALPTWIPSQEDNDTGYTKDPIYRQKTKKRNYFFSEMFLRDLKNNEDIHPTGKSPLKEVIRKYKDEVSTPDSGSGIYEGITEDSDSSSETNLDIHFLDATVREPGYKLDRRGRIIDRVSLLANTRTDIPSWRRKDLESDHLKNIVKKGADDQSFYESSLWAECLMYKRVAVADNLVQRKVLPSNEELHTAYRTFGRRSETFSKICGMICEETMGTDEGIIDVWVSYCIEDCLSDGTPSIIFVVIAKDTLKNIHLTDYRYHLISQNTYSRESEIVLARELSDETHDICSKSDTLEELRKCIARHADDLLERHSNINVILPSLKKSKGYYSANHSIVDEPCIALYVPLKGCIPIHEDPFPQEIDGFKVDVLEGKFETYAGGPNEFHEHLKMGLAIHAKILDSNKHILGGTLGGFVNHPVYKMCGITCAHVVCSSEEMNVVKLCEIKDGFNKPVFQPMKNKSTPFGRVVMAVYKHGDESSSGVEAALFNIQERHPEDGSFPMAFNDIQAGFDENRPLTFNSGVVCEASAISPRTEVYKYGMATGITRGSFALQGAVVRKERMEGNRHSFGYSLKNQLVVLQIGVEPFAEAGDSGALVLIDGGHHDSVAIGIVEGGIKGRVFVTPICDILRAFGCSNLEMYKFNSSNNGSLSTDSGVDVDDSEAMDVNN